MDKKIGEPIIGDHSQKGSRVAWEIMPKQLPKIFQKCH
jgi:hypothetical protein